MSPRVEPEWAMVTILFVDIRAFTTLADRSTAHEAVAYLNEFFGLVVPILAATRTSCWEMGCSAPSALPSGSPTTPTARSQPPRTCWPR